MENDTRSVPTATNAPTMVPLLRLWYHYYGHAIIPTTTIRFWCFNCGIDRIFSSLSATSNQTPGSGSIYVTVTEPTARAGSTAAYGTGSPGSTESTGSINNSRAASGSVTGNGSLTGDVAGWSLAYVAGS